MDDSKCYCLAAFLKIGYTPLPGTGIVKASTELIRHWLMIAEEFEIVNAQMEPNGQVITFTVRHMTVPITPDGAELPLFTPVFQTKHDEDGIKWYRLLKISVTERS